MRTWWLAGEDFRFRPQPGSGDSKSKSLFKSALKIAMAIDSHAPAAGAGGDPVIRTLPRTQYACSCLGAQGKVDGSVEVCYPELSPEDGHGQEGTFVSGYSLNLIAGARRIAVVPWWRITLVAPQAKTYLAMEGRPDPSASDWRRGTNAQTAPPCARCGPAGAECRSGSRPPPLATRLTG